MSDDALFCIDKSKLPKAMYGSRSTGGNFNFFEVQLAHCASKIQYSDGSVTGGAQDDCIFDHDYLDNFFAQ